MFVFTVLFGLCDKRKNVINSTYNEKRHSRYTHPEKRVHKHKKRTILTFALFIKILYIVQIVICCWIHPCVYFIQQYDQQGWKILLRTAKKKSLGSHTYVGNLMFSPYSHKVQHFQQLKKKTRGGVKWKHIKYISLILYIHEDIVPTYIKPTWKHPVAS